MIVYTLLLFLSAATAGTLLVFPAARDRLADVARRFAQWIAQFIDERLQARDAVAVLASAVLLGGLPLAALLAAAHHGDPYEEGRERGAEGGGARGPAGPDSRGGADDDAEDDAWRPVNAQVAHALDGEHLVPPQPLPPLAFTTAEVTLVRPLLAGASRDWTLLDDGFSQRLLLVFRIMRERHGYDMALLEGYRSPQRQDQLAAAGPHVTSARAYQSYHQFGQAADCAFVRDGKLVISERDPWAMRGYQLYGETAEAVGLAWGGRWAMMDFGHVELHATRN